MSNLAALVVFIKYRVIPEIKGFTTYRTDLRRISDFITPRALLIAPLILYSFLQPARTRRLLNEHPALLTFEFSSACKKMLKKLHTSLTEMQKEFNDDSRYPEAFEQFLSYLKFAYDKIKEQDFRNDDVVLQKLLEIKKELAKHTSMFHLKSLALEPWDSETIEMVPTNHSYYELNGVESKPYHGISSLLEKHPEIEENEIPEDFKDTVSFGLMRDPVIITDMDGEHHTYDRATILKHFETCIGGKKPLTSPNNNSIVSAQTRITPNIELRQKIEAWVSEKINEQTGNHDNSKPQIPRLCTPSPNL
jgi:hypothetical protein